MTKEELKQELKILKEKTDAVTTQFSIVCELILSRLEDIDRCQGYIMDQLLNNRSQSYIMDKLLNKRLDM